MSDQIETQKNINKCDVGSTSASTAAAAADADAEVMRWEKFLPKMSLRVLLIDPDDSTRQIIAALLRKCGYRVAAVPDGLKAWEVLKARSHIIDLILTEVDLPSISGFSLLTLIMEHHICKSIPVIMTSSQHSVSTVYKCMLKGAVDFLVKPIRKNELRNLWQHVWRKQAVNGGGPGPPEESVAQQNFEATAKNNASSGGSMGVVKRNRECIEIESDDESSCAKPEMDAEGAADIECVQKEGINFDDQRKKGKMISPDHSRVAMDLIGAFDNYQKCIISGNINANKIDPSPSFELSLQRSHATASVKQDTDERNTNLVNASAFSRHIYGASTFPSTSKHQKGVETGISFENLSKPSALMKPPTFCMQSGISPMQRSGSVGQLEASFQRNTFHPLNQQARNPEPKLETEENRGYYSSAIHLNAYSTFCDGSPVMNLTSELGKEEASPTHDENSHRFIQREAALNKFRLKRKERCFEKKVRYESRKKLAEKRPRVKGQFVRQGQNEPPADSS